MSARANPVTEAYLAECATPDSRLRRALAELDVSETMRAAWPRLLPRPVMVGEAEFLAFGRDLVTIFELITSLPQRCFDGDFERFRAALGIDERHGAWMRRLLGDGPPPLYGRADTYYDGSSFKLLEFNIGGALGGLETVSLLPKAYLRIPAFAEFADEHGLGYLDMGRDLAVALRNAGKAIGAGEPVVAVLLGGLVLGEHLAVSGYEWVVLPITIAGMAAATIALGRDEGAYEEQLEAALALKDQPSSRST